MDARTVRNALIVAAILALLAWSVTWYRAPRAVATAAAQEWPAGLGTMDAAAGRFPQLQPNAASATLMALASRLPQNAAPQNAVEEFVGREITRGELTIGAPPALPDVTAIRELLLREPVVWRRYLDIGEAEGQTVRGAQMTVARALVATALSRARANDAAAWEDLHAVWNLARSFDAQPQMMMRTAALSMERMINAVAWKMPLPAPAWLGELQQRDDVRPLLEAFHYQAASYRDSGARLFPTQSLAQSIEHDRRIADAVFHETRCDVVLPMNDLGVDVASVWRRAFRYRAEREATANALRLREGKPIDAASRCSDGGWSLDGTTLRFRCEIAPAENDRAMPLVLSAGLGGQGNAAGVLGVN